MALKTELKRLTMFDIALSQTLATRTITDSRQSLLQSNGLTSPAEWFVLGIVCGNQNRGIRVTDLARRLRVNTTYITAMLNQLKQKGYVRTQPDKNDGRARLIVATPAGIQKMQQLEEITRLSLEKQLSLRVTSEQFEAYLHVIDVFAGITAA